MVDSQQKLLKAEKVFCITFSFRFSTSASMVIKPFHLNLFCRFLTAWDETVEQLDSVRRENKNLGDEIKDLLDQLGEGGRSIHELDKQRRRLQVFPDSSLMQIHAMKSTCRQESLVVLHRNFTRSS